MKKLLNIHTEDYENMMMLMSSKIASRAPPRRVPTHFLSFGSAIKNFIIVKRDFIINFASNSFSHCSSSLLYSPKT